MQTIPGFHARPRSKTNQPLPRVINDLVYHDFEFGPRSGSPLCCFLRRGLDLGQLLPLSEAALLLQAHDLEAVEVGKVLPPLDLGPALVPVGLLPLLIDVGLLPELLQSSMADAAGKLVDDEGGEEGRGEAKRLTGNDEIGV